VQQTPKHLFHFIIRYEGEGIIDSNVVKFAKALQDKVGVNTPYTCPTPVPSAPVPAPPVGSPLSYSNSSSSGWVKVEEMPTSSHRPRMPTADEPGRVAPMPMLPSVPAPAPYPPPPPPVVRN
jgi:hypothetical protein